MDAPATLSLHARLAALPPECAPSILDGGPSHGGRGFLAAWPWVHRQVTWTEAVRARGELLELLAYLESTLAPHAGPGPDPRASQVAAAGPLAVLALSYETGWLLQGRTPPHSIAPGAPLADLALYSAWVELDHAHGTVAVHRAPAADPAAVRAMESISGSPGAAPARLATLQLSRWRPAFDPPAYALVVERIREYIAAGDVYQLNLVNRLESEARGHAGALYLAALQAAPAPYAAHLGRPGWQLTSLSPERFLHRHGSTLAAAPIKGTAARPADRAADARAAAELERDPKNRAENVMITDLFRSDLGRVARTGSVRVPALCRVRSFPTVHHLESVVEAEVREGVSLAEVLCATFPSGSITGAPKLRAMELIGELEPDPRGFSMGAVGVFRARDRYELSVAIRTLELRGGRATFPVGGAITWDSTAESEWDECLTKRSALERALQAQVGP